MGVRIPGWPIKVRRVFTSQEFGDRIGWGQDAVGIPDAWVHTRGKSARGTRVRVGVLDTGVDHGHVLSGDLSNVVDALDATGQYGPWDTDGHGSHVASIVGASADDRGIVGVAPDCEIISIRCMRAGFGEDSWIEHAFYLAQSVGCQVINCSFGTDQPTEAMADLLEDYVQGGGFVVASSGNLGYPGSVLYPGRWSGPHGRKFLDTIAVAAEDETGQLCPFSSTGPEVDIAAPGANITGCWLNNGYATISGTSMAAPLVAGVTALLVARHLDLTTKARTPLNTTNDLREHLKRGAVAGETGTGWRLRRVSDVVQDQDQGNGATGQSMTEEDVMKIDLGGATLYMPSRAGGWLSVGPRDLEDS